MILSQRTQFLNFKPTDGFQLYTDALIGNLLNLAPSDATGLSMIEKRGERYSCKIEITSAIGRFEAFIEGFSARSALEEARRRIIRQLSKWRRQRFAFTGSA
ncbi:MAG: hypothetical protein AB1540_03935 [Bdellovibrionota bacterium]